MKNEYIKSVEILKKVIYIYIILIFFLLLVSRYYNISNTTQFSFFLLYFSFSIIIGFFGLKKYIILFNPLTFYSLFILIVAFSFLRFSLKQNVISPKTLFVINISIVSFIIPYILSFKIPAMKFINGNNKYIEIIKIYKVLLFMTVSIFIIETIINRAIPLIDSFNGIDSYNNYIRIPMLHYFINLSAILPGLSYFLYKRKKIKIIPLINNNIISMFIVLNTQSRQLLLLVLLMISFFMIKEHYSFIYLKKINRFLIISGLLFVFLFMYLGAIRTGSADMNELLTSYAHIDNVKEINLIEIWFNLYGPKNITTLDLMIQKVNKITDFTYGIYSFKPFISLFLIDRLGIIQYNPEYDGFKALATYIWEPYIDFGIFGVLFISFIYGLISKMIFEKFIKNRSARTTLQLGTISYCILMSGFTNFYFSFFIWLIFFLSFLFPLEDN